MKSATDVLKQHSTKHHSKALTGSTANLYPVVLDNGKTIIYISDKSKEEATRLKYMMRGQQANPELK
jgi:c-di-AMP phosphodiesterase-like protein